jgi:hypothetical protein
MLSLLDLTRQPSAKIKKAIKWSAHQNEEILLELFKFQKKTFFKLKFTAPDVDLIVLSAAAYVIAVVDIHEQYLDHSSKNRTGDLTKTRSSSRLRAKALKKKKSSPKFEKLLLKKNLLLQLIETEGLSYRETSKYLMRYHNIDISHTLVGKAYNILIEKGKTHELHSK